MPKGKPKTFTTPKKKQKIVNKPPETADEYLAAGVELEESGEKWRAGDAAKASRFFVRAIEAYNEGLSLYPSSFDMAYNKARIQYDITQRPNLLAQASASLPELLQQALDSHRRALSLDDQSADLMFNTGQVLASLADATEDDDHRSMQYLEEALKLFKRCLIGQETLLAERANFEPPKGIEEDDQGDDGGVAVDETSMSPSTGEAEGNDGGQWAFVVEPTTHASLVETCIAALDSLAALYGILDSETQDALTILDALGGTWSQKIDENVSSVEDDELRDEARCSLLKCQAASFEATFQSGAIDHGEYSRRLTQSIEAGLSNMGDTSKFFSSCADAFIAFSVATAELANAASARWSKLSKALEYLEQASKISNNEEVASIHMGRGDAELFRFSLCLEGNLPVNVSNEKVQARLLKNAETYYRGAAGTAKSLVGQQKLHTAAIVKLTVCVSLGDDSSEAIAQLQKENIADADIVEVLNGLVEESLILRSVLQEHQIF